MHHKEEKVENNDKPSPQKFRYKSLLFQAMSDNLKIEDLKTKNNDQNNNGDDTSLKF